MNVLVFEFLVGGGAVDQHPFDNGLANFLEQGHSMLLPLCEDLIAAGHNVVVPVDCHVDVRLPSLVETINVSLDTDLQELLCGEAEQCDAVIVIAPESHHCLESILEWLEPFSDKLVSPHLEFVQLTGNKWKCSSFLRKHGIPVPRTWKVQSAEQVALLNWRPNRLLVAKPLMGAGSEHVMMVSHRNQLAQLEYPFLLQTFAPGTPVSVSVVNGKLMEPGIQVFDREPFGIHVRTDFPLPLEQRERALNLANRVVDCLPTAQGYFGMDMVIGETSDQDVLIEVNPRLTTSYGFLRAWQDKSIPLPFADVDSLAHRK